MSIVATLLFLSHWGWASQAPLPPPPAPAAPALSAYKIDPQSITISGVSSGGFMAVQMGVAFAKKISAVASVAGGIYWCSEGNTEKAKEVCMGHPEQIDSQVQIAQARKLSTAGDIDPVGELRRQKIYIFASPKDKVIMPLNSEKLSEFYRAFVPASQINVQMSFEAAHGFPTLNAGNPCQFAFLPWLLKCQFDLAGEILQSAYGALTSRGPANPQHLIRFSQTEFGDEKTPLYKEGWVYVPAECQQGALCRLHIALHGCQMNPDFIQDKFASLAGFNEWAENNRIIVLYPQSAKLPDVNPYACWDWFGFTGPAYMTKAGAQMQALSSMIEKISQ